MNNRIIYFCITVLLFVILFYHNDIGLNLGLFTVLLVVLAFYAFPKNSRRKDYWLATSGALLCAFSFAYFQDVASFFGIFLSLHWLSMIAFDPDQKMIKALLLVPLNYIMMLPKVFSTKLNVSKSRTNRTIQRIMALVLIPLGITAVFVFMYVVSSSVLTGFFEQLSFDFNLNVFHIIALLTIGSILLYNFWFFGLPRHWFVVNEALPDDFNTDFSEFTLDELLRSSGTITFMLLNIALLVFIGIYGYENFFMPEEISTISQNVHERVYAVIGSIVLAIGLIMFYFKGYFNFDPGNGLLKKLTFTWIFLNAILIVVTFVKNMQYVSLLGLTEKRIGVFIFLILCLIGLFFTFRKVKFRKTNWFLLHRMMKAFYVTLLLVAIINWSWVITKYNIVTGKIESDLPYHFQLPHNHLIMSEYLNENSVEILRIKPLEKEIQLDGKFYDFWVHRNLNP